MRLLSSDSCASKSFNGFLFISKAHRRSAQSDGMFQSKILYIDKILPPRQLHYSRAESPLHTDSRGLQTRYDLLSCKVPAAVMAMGQLILITVFLLFFSTPILSVRILFEWWTRGLEVHSDGPLTAEFNPALPGFCCKPDPDFVNSLWELESGATTFYGLLYQQIGFGWSATGNNPSTDIPECTGLPILRVSGPSGDTWSGNPAIDVYNPPGNFASVEGTPQSVVFAATWIDLRTRLPPSSADARYLQWQGVKGAVWGKNSWNIASGGIPFGSRKRSVERKLNGYALQGTAYITPPARVQYPTMYAVFGTNYTGLGNGSYSSEDGRLLNLKNPLGK